MSACYLHHKIPPRCPNSQPICTTPPHNSPIAYTPLCIQSVEVSKHHRTTCKFITVCCQHPTVYQQIKATTNSHCTYCLIVRSVRVNIVTVKCSDYFGSFSYLSFNAHAPYSHLWPAPLYNNSLHYLISSTIF